MFRLFSYTELMLNSNNFNAICGLYNFLQKYTPIYFKFVNSTLSNTYDPVNLSQVC